jgi:hypothetical protein
VPVPPPHPGPASPSPPTRVRVRLVRSWWSAAAAFQLVRVRRGDAGGAGLVVVDWTKKADSDYC